ncbi:hypothetical protein LTR37_013529 [Vermiconidia calcicola]|uniref:Uncharacterized protein n=1 Tax=Vermiconidia calcicola TaxID=1690605 RepID=A0ACC3MWY6_9PEZI|nr:hypothetical protein LTR37_013529 [Vermiconidia calcicola]
MAKRLRRDSVSSEAEDDDTPVPPKSRSQSIGSAAHTPKYASLDTKTSDQSTTMRCHLPPHKPLKFASYPEYESHYQQAHTNRCTDCRKNFPTGHFLELHIAENHDPIVASKHEAGEKTYSCFVEGCEKVCSGWQKRRSHLVDKHGYPKNYDFLTVDHGIDGRRSMLRPGVDAQGHRKSSRERKRSSSSATEATQTTEAISVSEPNGLPPSAEKGAGAAARESAEEATEPRTKKEAGMDELATSFSSLKMVPRSVTFGKRKGRSGFAKS